MLFAWLLLVPSSIRNKVTHTFSRIGPKSNPAELSTDGQTSIQKLFTELFRGAVASGNSVKFLSRFDKSATNVKENNIWTEIGQVPWAYPYSFFYHVMPAFPFQALEAAARLGEYHLVDWGTWNGVDDWVREDMIIHVSSNSALILPYISSPDHLSLGNGVQADEVR